MTVVFTSYHVPFQEFDTEGAAHEGQTGRLLRPSDRSDFGLQREGSQRAEAESRHQALGQTGERVNSWGSEDCTRTSE